MVKKIVITFVLVILLSGLALWSPWRGVSFSVPEFLGFKPDEVRSGLQVYSMAGEIEVYVDNELSGNVTVEGSPLDIFDIEPGEHLITVRRVSEGEGVSYYEYNRMINFLEGVNVVLAYEIGPSKNFSSGYLIYATPAVNEDRTTLNIRTEPEETQITINDLDEGKAPLTNYELDLDKDYKVKISRTNTELIEFNILPEDENERENLKSLDLNVEASLFLLPLEVREENE